MEKALAPAFPPSIQAAALSKPAVSPLAGSPDPSGGDSPLSRREAKRAEDIPVDSIPVGSSLAGSDPADAGHQAASQGGYDVVQLVQEHQQVVWRYLRSLGCEASLADDLTQETFLSVLEKPFEYQGEAATGAYLRRVAHNLYVTMQRRSARVRYVEDWDLFESAWEQWVVDGRGEMLLAALRVCLTRLTPRAKWALEMRFRDKRSREKIAAALEITPHGAKNLMQRAKKQLRDCVDAKMAIEDRDTP